MIFVVKWWHWILSVWFFHAVVGGKFFKFNPADNVSEGPNTNFVGENCAISENDGVYTVSKIK